MELEVSSTWCTAVFACLFLCAPTIWGNFSDQPNGFMNTRDARVFGNARFQPSYHSDWRGMHLLSTWNWFGPIRGNNSITWIVTCYELKVEEKTKVPSPGAESPHNAAPPCHYLNRAAPPCGFGAKSSPEQLLRMRSDFTRPAAPLSLAVRDLARAARSAVAARWGRRRERRRGPVWRWVT